MLKPSSAPAIESPVIERSPSRSRDPRPADIPFDVIETARNHPFLRAMYEEDSQRLIAQCRVLRFELGEIVLHAGQANDTLFLVLQGSFLARLDPMRTDDGVVIGAGECVGEMSVIEGKPVSATIIATETSHLLALPGAVLWSTIAAVGGVARSLLQAMSERVRQRSELVLQSMRDRMEFESVQKELKLAQEVQVNMLADGASLLKEYPQVDAKAVMVPAKIVGGDFFDAFGVVHDQVFIALGDVAGKGISAALFMARSLATLRLGVVSGQSHDTLVARVNNALCEHNTHSTFVTLFAGFLDLRSGELAYFNAGHHAALLLSRTGGVTELPRPEGIVAGAFVGADYGTARYALQRGDMLIAFTDGVTEAQNPSGEFFGDARVRETLASARPSTADEAVTALRTALENFTVDAPQYDDITILAVRYLADGDRSL